MNLFRRLSLSWRMALLIVAGTCVIFAAILAYSYVRMSHIIFENTVERNRIMTEWVTERIGHELFFSEQVVRIAAEGLTISDGSAGEVETILSRAMKTQPDLCGMAYVRIDSPDTPIFFYISRDTEMQEAFTFGRRQNTAVDLQADWFNLPYYLHKPVWVDPYVDPDIQCAMITYAFPVLKDSRVVAIVTCDLTTDFIWEIVAQSQISESGSCVVATAEGVIVAHKDSSIVRKETIFSLAERPDFVNPKRAEEFRQLGYTMLSQDSGFVQYRRSADDIAHWMHFLRIPSVNGVVGVYFSERQVLAELVEVNRTNAVMVVFGILLLSIFAVILAYSIARPLEQLSHSAGEISVGNFNARIPHIKGAKELVNLGVAFARMRDNLQEHIHQLTIASAMKEKAASELAIAREIQQGMVPKLFPPFPEHPGVDLFAKLEPALAVGGDLYDFAMLDNDRVYISIGDVSGKGVPASLLMAVGKTLMKTAIMSYQDPAKALTITNAEIAAHNDACMFITFFCAILDLRNGQMTYVNAGHNPPMIFRKSSGVVDYLEECHGPAVGVVKEIAYHASTTELAEDDLLLLYTDGITEAMNADMKMYSDDRLRDFMLLHGSESATDFILRLYEDVHAHAAGVKQWDDMTTLAIRGRINVHRKGFIPDSYEIHLVNQPDELAKLLSWAETIGEKFHIPLATASRLRLIMEEWFTNLLRYAWPDDDTRHQISLAFSRKGADVELTFTDDGVPFDPTACTVKPDPDADSGLGIHNIRKTVDSMEYKRANDRNIVTFRRKIVPSADEYNASFAIPEESGDNRVEFVASKGHLVAAMPPRIDTNTVEHIQKQLLKVVNNGHATSALICDFSHTVYISSAGLRMMLILARKIRADGGILKLRRLIHTVREPFMLAGFSTLMEILDD